MNPTFLEARNGLKVAEAVWRKKGVPNRTTTEDRPAKVKQQGIFTNPIFYLILVSFLKPGLDIPGGGVLLNLLRNHRFPIMIKIKTRIIVKGGRPGINQQAPTVVPFHYHKNIIGTDRGLYFGGFNEQIYQPVDENLHSLPYPLIG